MARIELLWDGLWSVLVFSSAVFSISYGVAWFVVRMVRNFPAVWGRRLFRLAQAQTLALSFLYGIEVAFGTDSAMVRCFQDLVLTKEVFVVTRAFALLWIAGVILGLAWDFWREWKGTRELDLKSGIESSELQGELSEVWEHFGEPSRLQVALMETSGSPFVYGLRKAVVFFPIPLLEALSPAERRAVLAHEAAHVVGHDVAWNLVELFLRRVFFFHPFAWLCRRPIAQCQEKTADAMAVKSLNLSVRFYAETLLKVACWARPMVEGPRMAYMQSHRADLEDRLSALTHCHLIPRRPSTVWCGLILLAGGWSAVQARAELSPIREANSPEQLVCPQVRHEQALEWIFRVKPIEIRCDERK